MRHRKTIILSFVILVIAGMVVEIYWRRWSGPWYKGRSLRSWLEQGAINRSEEDSRASAEAVRHMGTNTIPALLRMMRSTNSPLTQKLWALHEDVEFIPYPYSIDAREKHQLAAYGFGCLGGEATNAIPDLLGIYHQNVEQSELAYGVLLSLVRPEEKVGLLKEGLTNKNEEVRRRVVVELSSTNAPEMAVPLLITALADPSSSTRAKAFFQLREFGTNALPFIPALVPLAAMGTTNFDYSPARQSLIALDPDTAAKVLTNGRWTYEWYTNTKATVRKKMEAEKNANPGDRILVRRGRPVQNNK